MIRFFLLVLILMGCTRHDTTLELQECGDGKDIYGMVLLDPTQSPFFMGSSSSQAYSDEKPVHAVSLSRRFWMDSTEVTQEQFRSVMEVAGFGVPNWIFTGDSLPAHMISWGKAVLYCNARSIEAGFDTVYTYREIVPMRNSAVLLKDIKIDFTKNGFRLPTEAEWEFAARGSLYGDYPWDENSEYAYDYSWFWDNSQGRLHPVGEKSPNSFGLYDMVGNAHEWCSDYYVDVWYTYSPEIDPFSSSDFGTGRVLRGGHFKSEIEGLRVTSRLGSSSYSSSTGFRTVRNASSLEECYE